MIKRTLNKAKGFTLVEIIVSLMIFSIVAVVALAALVKIIDANKKAQTIQDAVTNLSFTLDSMSRELRTGSKLDCQSSSNGNFTTAGITTNACPLGQNQLIAFQSTNVDTTASPSCRLVYAYWFTSSDPRYPGQQMLEKAEQSPGNNCSAPFTQSSFSSIMSPNVTLASYELGESYDKTTMPYPLIFISLSGSTGNKATTQTFFTVQTAASPRLP